MQVVQQDSKQVVLAFAPEELATICNALNEALDAIEEWEFSARMGATRQEAEALLAALARLQPPRPD
jgi:hypothetical protein